VHDPALTVLARAAAACAPNLLFTRPLTVHCMQLIQCMSTLPTSMKRLENTSSSSSSPHLQRLSAIRVLATAENVSSRKMASSYFSHSQKKFLSDVPSVTAPSTICRRSTVTAIIHCYV